MGQSLHGTTEKLVGGHRYLILCEMEFPLDTAIRLLASFNREVRLRKTFPSSVINEPSYHSSLYRRILINFLELQLWQ